MLFGACGGEVLNVSLFLSAVYHIYYRYYCYPHFHGICIYVVMCLVLTSVCCDSNILLFTQTTSAPASPSAEILIFIGTHEYYVKGMVCGSCVLMMRSNSSIFSLILGVKNNPPLQMIRCMSLKTKTHKHRGGTMEMTCARNVLLFIV